MSKSLLEKRFSVKDRGSNETLGRIDSPSTCYIYGNLKFMVTTLPIHVPTDNEEKN